MCESVISITSLIHTRRNDLLALLLKVVDVDITSDDGHILESLFGGCSVDMKFLGFGV